MLQFLHQQVYVRRLMVAALVSINSKTTNSKKGSSQKMTVQLIFLWNQDAVFWGRDGKVKCWNAVSRWHLSSRMNQWPTTWLPKGTLHHIKATLEVSHYRLGDAERRGHPQPLPATKSRMETWIHYRSRVSIALTYSWQAAAMLHSFLLICSSNPCSHKQKLCF